MIEPEQLTRIIEGALLASDKPLSLQQLAELFEEQERPEPAQIREALERIEQSCQGRGFELKQLASGYRFQVVQDVAPWVGRLWDEKPQRYSRAMLETLALIAYRQPITRGDIEEIRGVAVNTNIIKTLQEREWIRIVGHKDVPGRPAMFATTRKFLDYFNLRNLDELPTLADIKDLDSMNGELAFGEVESQADAEPQSGDDADSEAEGGAEGESGTEGAAAPPAEGGDKADGEQGDVAPSPVSSSGIDDADTEDEPVGGEERSSDALSPRYS